VKEEHGKYFMYGMIIMSVLAISFASAAISLSGTNSEQEKLLSRSDSQIQALEQELSTLKSGLSTESQKDFNYIILQFSTYVNSTAANVTDWTAWRLVSSVNYPEAPAAPRVIIQTWNSTSSADQILQFYFVKENIWSTPINVTS